MDNETFLIVTAALEFVCNSVSDSETIGSVEKHGSRADALAAVAPDMVEKCHEALNRLRDG